MTSELWNIFFTEINYENYSIDLFYTIFTLIFLRQFFPQQCFLHFKIGLDCDVPNRHAQNDDVRRCGRVLCEEMAKCSKYLWNWKICGICRFAESQIRDFNLFFNTKYWNWDFFCSLFCQKNYLCWKLWFPQKEPKNMILTL